ncbi:MAG: acyl carrier protein phosphodiesterase [Cytophagaceae bacterium]|nr:acyl carrier protein phosphodiesterase [Cytophagaceae bacterium]
MSSLNTLFFSENKSENFTTGLIIGNGARQNYISRYNDEILKGILLAEKIRDFTENNEFVKASQNRLSTKHSKHKDFIIQVFYDHLLASNWEKYSSLPIEAFSEKIYNNIMENIILFPYKIRKFSPEMISKKWIGGLTTIEGTHRYVNMLFKKERFTNNLEHSLFELVESYQDYKKDFEQYFESLQVTIAIEQEKILQTDKVFLVSA